MAEQEPIHEFVITQGNSLKYRVLYEAAGVPANLAGFIANLVITSENGVRLEFDSNVDSRITLQAGTSSPFVPNIVAEITEEEMIQLQLGGGNYHELRLTDPSGYTVTALKGPLTITYSPMEGYPNG